MGEVGAGAAVTRWPPSEAPDLPCKRHIVISGASRGIGAALARHYAAPGVRLTLIARDRAALEATAEAAASKGPLVGIVTCDVREHDRLTPLLLALDAEAPIDLLIANAGIGGARSMVSATGEDPAAAHAVASVNFVGVVNLVAPLVAPMLRRRRGQIVIVSSVAGSTPMPLAPTYAASKAALNTYARNLQLFLAPQGVDVTLVSPGFVDTDMSKGVGPRPFLVSADQLAAATASAVERRQRHLVYPGVFRAVIALTALTPGAIIAYVMRKWDKRA